MALPLDIVHLIASFALPKHLVAVVQPEAHADGVQALRDFVAHRDAFEPTRKTLARPILVYSFAIDESQTQPSGIIFGNTVGWHYNYPERRQSP
jgi:hypothetical protein